VRLYRSACQESNTILQIRGMLSTDDGWPTDRFIIATCRPPRDLMAELQYVIGRHLGAVRGGRPRRFPDDAGGGDLQIPLHTDIRKHGSDFDWLPGVRLCCMLAGRAWCLQIRGMLGDRPCRPGHEFVIATAFLEREDMEEIRDAIAWFLAKYLESRPRRASSMAGRLPAAALRSMLRAGAARAGRVSSDPREEHDRGTA
jgi:hypothetical protein